MRKFCKEIELCINGFWLSFGFFKNLARERLQFQFFKDFCQFGFVGFADLQLVHVECNGNIRFDGCQKFGKSDVINMVHDFFLKGTLNIRSTTEELLDGSKLVDEFDGCLLTNSWASGKIVCRVAHQCQQVDDSLGGRDTIFGLHLFWPHHLVASAVTGSVDEDVLIDQLAIVFIRCQHIGLDILLPGFGCQGADDIVGLETIDLKDGNIPGF